MRIIAGDWRGRKLVAPPGRLTRPTSDRTRETLFSMLASRVGNFDGLRVADLYAGSGALGLEALSRGAVEARFVETDREALAAIRANVEALKAKATVSPTSAERLPPVDFPFDLILADPPYKVGSGNAVVQAVAEAGWLAPGGWLAIETDKKEEVEPGPFALETSRVVGRARLSLLFA